MESISGVIEDYSERRGGFVIFAPYENHNRMILREYKKAEVLLADSRRISSEQRKKAHALIGEIAEWVGEFPEFMKAHMKIEFMADRLNGMYQKMFSLSDCDMTTAREFISYLIEFVLAHEIPISVPLISLCDDIERYVYAALMHKRCAVCGKKAEPHHVDAIGMGNDRKEIYQIGMRVIPLCRVCLTTAHTKGVKWLTEDNHLIPIALTKEIGKVYGLTKKNLEGKRDGR